MSNATLHSRVRGPGGTEMIAFWGDSSIFVMMGGIGRTKICAGVVCSSLPTVARAGSMQRKEGWLGGEHRT